MMLSRCCVGLVVAAWVGSVVAAEAPWITVDDPAPAADRTTEYVKTFVNRAAVKSAVWTMTGLGVFDAYVNGRVVGDDVLKPGYTHHKKTKYLFTYDVTPMLVAGKGSTNVISAVQSGGWWSDRCVWGFKDGTKQKTAFHAELVLTYADGTTERIVTDASWRAAYAGPVVKASIWEGETYDARIEPTWRTTGACDFPAAAVTNGLFAGELKPLVGPKIVLRTDLVLRPVSARVWREAVGATDTNRFGTIKVLREPKGMPVSLAAGEKLLLDFGQNAAAIPLFDAVAQAGVKLVVRGVEMLNDGDGLKSRGNDGPGGSPYFTNYRSSRNTNFTYVFAGKGVETAMPRHTFFGYRYLQLEADGDVEIRRIVSVPVSSVTKESELGRIETGNADVNRLVRNCVWGMYSNYLSVPTDCPQRDERQGWAGDTQVFAPTATYVADVNGFLRKWMRDMRDAQLPNGGFSVVAPMGDDGQRPEELNYGRRFGWSDAGVIVPHVVWRQTGDTTIIDENWTAMTRYLDLLEKSKFRTPTGTNTWLDRGFQFGDWLSYERWESFADEDKLMKTHEAEDWWNFLGGCYWRSDAQMMAEMARATGRTAEAKRFADMAEAALKYLRKEFLAKDGLLLEKFRDMQTATLFALRADIFETPAAKAKSAELLRANIAAHGGCLQTGFLGTSILLDMVAEHLGTKDAYDLLLQRKEPSWLFTIDNGATTMWERWNSYTKAAGFGKAGMNSFNHYAYGAVLGWLYQTAAGIASDPRDPGYRTIVMRPQPDRRLGFVEAEYRSAAGLVRSAWRYEGEKWLWEFSVPEGAKALVTVPGAKETRTYPAGNHRVERAVADARSDAEKNDSTAMNRTGGDPTVHRAVEGGVRVLFIGNSITLHAPAPAIGWTNDWGMAASAAEKDFVHLVTAGIERETGRKADVLVRNLADFERNFETYDPARICDLVAFKPDYLVVALGENVRALATKEDRLAYREAFKKLLKRFTYGRMKPNVVVRGAFWPNPDKDELMAHAASDLAMTFVKTACTDDSQMAKGLFRHPGVAAHPGDKGMAETARLILEGFFPKDSGYAAWVDGKPAAVRPIRVSRQPFNQWAPGYQRPADQTEIAGMLRFETDGAAKLRVRPTRTFKFAKVRPLSAKVVCDVKDGEVSFTLPKPGAYVLELDGIHRPLEIFAQPRRDFAAERKAANIVFGPGLHEPVVVKLKSHDRVYIDRDAVVLGSFRAAGVEDVRVSGYGIICGSRNRRVGDHCYREGMDGAVLVYDSKNVVFDGPTVLDSCCWCVSAFNSSDLEFANLKVTGAWRYNTDGIDICNSQRVRVHDCYVHSFDDNLVVKGNFPACDRRDPVEDVRFERCVCWCGWGRTLEIGFETFAPHMRNIVYEDCDLIHSSAVAMDVNLGGPAPVKDVVFRNIRIEYDPSVEHEILQRSRDQKADCLPGNSAWWLMAGNYKMFGPNMPYGAFGYDSTNDPYGTVDGLTVEDIDITVEPGAPLPRHLIEPQKGSKFGRIDVRNVRINGAETPAFVAARPVWAKGREREQNLTLRFTSSVELTGKEKQILVRATGCSAYRLRVNDAFAGYGPARGPKGMDRVDEWDIRRFVRAGKNDIEIDVAGYNVANYYLPDQPSYLRAEVVADGKAVAATGDDSFRAQALNRVQKVPRYSFQRPFCEVWNVPNLLVGEPLELVVQPVKPLLPRRAAYPDFAVNERAKKLSDGLARYDATAKVRNYWPLDVTGPTKDARGFPLEECAIIPTYEAERYVDDLKGTARTSVWDFGLLDCGFIGVKAKVRGKGRILVVFDEVLTGGKVDFLRGGTANVVVWNVDRPGELDLESFEPYAFRYAKFIVDGDIELGTPYIRTYKSPSADGVACPTQDPELRKIFEAARETFKQNAVDVFTDCPGRERAGWLCDSYFTARVSKHLTGSLALEELFLENFLYADCPDIPKAMFPMCYPSDHVNRNFIPNWAMWLVLELEEYLGRGGDPALVRRFEPKVLALVDYLGTFENKDGLLENLPAWVFVEWSECNNLTKGVNYPSNMTWARVLEAVAKLYGRSDLRTKAAKMRETILRQSFDGMWFRDQALRDKDDRLVVQPQHTETCQYYAFYFGVATPATQPKLWKTLVEEFGPARKLKNGHPDVPFSNAFIGNYLRLELLQRAGLGKTVEANIRGYFLPMAEKTGTLWEHDAPTASCCHGFASYIAVLLALTY